MKIDKELSELLDNLAVETVVAAQESIVANPNLDPSGLFVLAISFSYHMLIERMQPIAKLPVHAPSKKKVSKN